MNSKQIGVIWTFASGSLVAASLAMAACESTPMIELAGDGGSLAAPDGSGVSKEPAPGDTFPPSPEGMPAGAMSNTPAGSKGNNMAGSETGGDSDAELPAGGDNAQGAGGSDSESAGTPRADNDASQDDNDGEPSDDETQVADGMPGQQAAGCEQASACGLAAGAPCARSAECETGHCVDGSCCQEASCAECEACNPGSGTCQPVTDADDPDSCAGSCDGDGSCKARGAARCSDDDECLSGYCTDGLCCDARCDDTCAGCRQPGSEGSCTAIIGGKDPDTCGGSDNACGVAGDCLVRDQVQMMGIRPEGWQLGGQGQNKAAQIVIPGVSGQLAQVRLWITCGTGSTAIVEVQSVVDGMPSGDVLAQAMKVGGFETPHTFVFDFPADVVAGRPFALVMRADGECGGPRTDTDAYPGANFAINIPSWPSWTETGGDAPFVTFVLQP